MNLYSTHYADLIRFARFRNQPEYQTAVDAVNTARKQHQYQSEPQPFPTDEMLHLVRHLEKVGDPRAALVQRHADFLDGLHTETHVGDTRIDKPLGRGAMRTLKLPDGTDLWVESRGHYEQPGVHRVAVHWNTFSGHFTPEEARGLADKFGEVHEDTGRQFHEALDAGEAEADKQWKW